MGFRSKIKTKEQLAKELARSKAQAKKPTTTKKEINKFDLDRNEINYILGLIKDTTFKGSEIERLYNIVYKLQSQYLKQGKNV
jgi:hypothetical protein|tara:strand:- start:128 stop:376 length:249 start_codon:yes stop_codon:yes gene_type:complete